MHIFRVVLTAVSVASVVLVCGNASADSDDDPRAGTRGHVTARMPGGTVIDVDPCPSTRSNTFDYVTCGSRFRAKINERMCATHGKGKHRWLYQVGSSHSMIVNVARCE